MKCPICDNKIKLNDKKKEEYCDKCKARYVIEDNFVKFYYFPTMVKQKIRKGDL